MKRIIGLLAITIALVSCSTTKTTTLPTAQPTKTSYSTSSSSTPTIQTGSRGGHYYINSKGNKTYTKKR